LNELKRRGDALAMIISDQRMPGMLGVDLLARCREPCPVTQRVPLNCLLSDIKAAGTGDQ
jgi:thioredoxin reductase (NADPH)